MKHFRQFSFLRLFAVSASVVLLASLAAADPITPGNVLVNFLNNPSDGSNQGTASGYFTITSPSPGNFTLSDYDFQVSQTANCCTFTKGFQAFEYKPNNAGQTSQIFTFANGDQEVGFHADHSFPGGSGTTLVIHFNCNGVVSCLTNNLAVNNSFEVTFAEVGNPDGLPFRSTGKVFMHITDDPGVFSLNLDQTLLPGTTLIGGTQTPAVPEPATLSLFGAGLVGLRKALKRKK